MFDSKRKCLWHESMLLVNNVHHALAHTGEVVHRHFASVLVSTFVNLLLSLFGVFFFFYGHGLHLPACQNEI